MRVSSLARAPAKPSRTRSAGGWSPRSATRIQGAATRYTTTRSRLSWAPASHPPPPRGGLLRPGRGADRAGGDAQDHGSSGLVRGGGAGSRPPALEPGDGADQSVAHLLPRRDGPVFRRGSRRAHAAAGSPDRSGGPGEAHGLFREVRLRVRGAPARAVARISARYALRASLLSTALRPFQHA